MAEKSIPEQTRIGHVHLKVADLERAVKFYHEVMGFDIVADLGTAAFLSAGGYHHHLGLNTWESLGGSPPPTGTTGLYHFAINYPTRRDLAAALARLLDAGWGIDGASSGAYRCTHLRSVGLGMDAPQERFACVNHLTPGCFHELCVKLAFAADPAAAHDRPAASRRWP